MNLRTVDIIVISAVGVIIAAGVIISIIGSGNDEVNPVDNNGTNNSFEARALAPASEPVLIDPFGSPVSEVTVDEQVLFQSEITNKQDKKQPFVYIVRIRNSEGITILVSWMKSELPANETFKVSQSWTPETTGRYDVETFVWDSIEGQTILSPARKISVDVLAP